MMKIEIMCRDDAGIGAEFHFELDLPNNTKRAKISFQKADTGGNDIRQVIVEEIEYYEVKTNEG